MARSEFDKLLAATNPKGETASIGMDFTRLMAEVLRLSKTPATKRPFKAPAVNKAVKAESAPVRLLNAAPVLSAPAAARLSGETDLGRLSSQVSQLRQVVAPVAVQAKTAAPTSSTLNTISKIFSTVFAGSGLGTIVSGITRLFGGGAPATSEPLFRFQLPQAVSVEAGVARNGQFVPVSYSQSGQARPNAVPAQFPERQTAPASQPMTVDSRWFMDHSEDIASAVKEAMLHSHSINDVVADL